MPAAWPHSFPFCSPLLSVHSMQQLDHLYPAKPLRHMQLLWSRNFSCSSDRHLQKKPVGVECLSEKEYSFQLLCSVSCAAFKCYLSWETQSGWKLAVWLRAAKHWGREESLSTEKVLTTPWANLVGQVTSPPGVRRRLLQQGIAPV